MKDTCVPGLQRTERFIVEGNRVVKHMGDHVGVYSTPSMVFDIEHTSRELLLEHLNEGEESVGTRVDIQHLSATPEGMWVEITTTITNIDRLAITFEAVARDAIEEVGRCTHQRFVVDVDKMHKRISAKAEKAKEL